MPIIVPAILTDSVEKLQEQVKIVSGFANRIQLDFALAPFIDPTSTVSPVDVPYLKFKGILEAHIMAQNPEQYCNDVQRMGCDMMYFHTEATQHPDRVIHEARAHGLKVGLAINPDSQWQKIKKKIIREVDAVMFMTVFPGRQGSTFQSQVLESIKAFKQAFSETLIAVDGGVNRETLPPIVQAGASFIAVGSAIWQATEGPEEAYKQLERIMNHES